MADFLKDLLGVSGNEYASVVEDGVLAGDFENYIDVGSHVLNALLSGSIHGGAPDNKITAFAGEQGTGKTYVVLSIVKEFLEKNKKSCVVYFESESALTKDMIQQRGIDTSRMIILPVATIQEFRSQCLKILEKYVEKPEEDRPKMIICLDSLGNLSTTKEMEDTLEGKETQDMTRARVIKGVFRVLTLKLARAKVPMFITNHTYAQVGQMYPQQIMSGGSGLQYCASTIVHLSKRKEKDGLEVIGNIIHCKAVKNRIGKENQMVDVLLTYDKGLHKYYGLSDIALKTGIFKKSKTRIELPDGTKVFEKKLNREPEKYYTEDIMNQIDEATKKLFLYGQSSDELVDNLEEDEGDSDEI